MFGGCRGPEEADAQSLRAAVLLDELDYPGEPCSTASSTHRRAHDDGEGNKLIGYPDLDFAGLLLHVWAIHHKRVSVQ